MVSAMFCALLLAPVALSAPGDMIIPRKEGGMSVQSLPASTFPHWVHRVRYRCDACHSELFEMKLGATEINMAMMAQGESCAVCHNGELAFKADFQSCNRCHRPAEP